MCVDSPNLRMTVQRYILRCSHGLHTVYIYIHHSKQRNYIYFADMLQDISVLLVLCLQYVERAYKAMNEEETVHIVLKILPSFSVILSCTPC